MQSIFEEFVEEFLVSLFIKQVLLVMVHVCVVWLFSIGQPELILVRVRAQVSAFSVGFQLQIS